MNNAPNASPYKLCWSAGGGIELSGISFFQLFLWHQVGKDYPAIVRVHPGAKRQMEILD